jgi:CRP/FNR family transcriptional regulator, cyclic AMP receptor protein
MKECTQSCVFSRGSSGIGKVLSMATCDTTFDERELHIIMPHTIRKKYAKDELIFLKGERGDYFFIILSGHVRIINQSLEGKEVILAILGSNEIFGEMSLIDGSARCATVVAQTSTEALAMSRSHFSELLRAEPLFFMKIMKLFIGRIRSSNAQIELLALRSIKGRIASLLLSWSRERPNESAFRLPHTHQDIASILGTSRECITRTLRELAEADHIIMEKNSVRIMDAKGLSLLSG